MPLYYASDLGHKSTPDPINPLKATSGASNIRWSDSVADWRYKDFIAHVLQAQLLLG